jgi:hypothetical protein
VQVWCPANLGDVAALGELGRHGDGICGLASAVQVQDRVVHDLVSGPVVVGRLDDLEHV